MHNCIQYPSKYFLIQVFVNMNDEQRTESTPSQGLVDHSVLYPHLTQKQQQPKHVKEFMLRKFFAIRVSLIYVAC